MSCISTVTLHIVDVRLTCLNKYYLLTYLLTLRPTYCQTGAALDWQVKNKDIYSTRPSGSDHKTCQLIDATVRRLLFVGPTCAARFSSRTSLQSAVRCQAYVQNDCRRLQMRAGLRELGLVVEAGSRCGRSSRHR